MSGQLKDCVRRHSRTKGNVRLLLLDLADYTRTGGSAYPSLATLSRDLGMTRRNVQKVIARAVAGGELEYVPGLGRGNRSRYFVRCGSPAVHSANGVPSDAHPNEAKGDGLDEKGVALRHQKAVLGDAKASNRRSVPHGTQTEHTENTGNTGRIRPARAAGETPDVAALLARGWPRVTERQRDTLFRIALRQTPDIAQPDLGRRWNAEVINRTPPGEDPLGHLMREDAKFVAERQAEAQRIEEEWAARKAQHRTAEDELYASLDKLRIANDPGYIDHSNDPITLDEWDRSFPEDD